MRSTMLLLVLIGGLALPAGADARKRAKPGGCPTDAAAAVVERCPCSGATVKRHGDYVSCVVGAAHELSRAGCMSRRDARGFARCAARSTCGRPDTVVCCAGTDGTCIRSAADDTAGICSNNPRRACVTDLACRSRVRIAPSESMCTAARGWVAPQGSVCGGCVAPPATTTSSTVTSTTSTSTTTTIAALTFGNPIEFPGASTHSPGYLLGGQMSIPRSCTVTHLAVIGKATGAQVKLALYSANHAGAPDRLLAATPATPIAVGPLEIAVAPVALPPGTYWIMGVYDADASIGVDETDGSALVGYVEQEFTSPTPDPFPGALWYFGQRFNYYVRVLE